MPQYHLLHVALLHVLTGWLPHLQATCPGSGQKEGGQVGERQKVPAPESALCHRFSQKPNSAYISFARTGPGAAWEDGEVIFKKTLKKVYHFGIFTKWTHPSDQHSDQERGWEEPPCNCQRAPSQSLAKGSIFNGYLLTVTKIRLRKKKWIRHLPSNLPKAFIQSKRLSFERQWLKFTVSVISYCEPGTKNNSLARARTFCISALIGGCAENVPVGY